MKTSNLFFSALILLITTAASCKKDNSKSAQTLYGTSVALGGDSVRSFLTVDENGQPQSVGLQFGENALNGLPTDTMPGMPNYMYHLSLPQNGNSTGVDHIEIDWNPFGHAPTAVYGVPHFDFHFYYVTQQEQSSVVPGPDVVPVPSEYVPKDYFSPVPVAVPAMGVHWFDSTAIEFHGKQFTSTFIYGFYHGKMTFLEPMIARTFLQTRPDFSSAIKQPQAFEKSNYYPVSYQIKYDSVKKIYILTLSSLVKH